MSKTCPKCGVNDKLSYRPDCRRCYNEYMREYRKTPEYKQYKRAWNKEDRKTESCKKTRREYSKRYNQTEKRKLWNRQFSMKREATKLNATPELTEYEKFLIELQYDFAQWITKDSGIKHQVDHYFPLRGVCCKGKHHPSNLRVITESKNRSKSNKCPLHKTGGRKEA